MEYREAIIAQIERYYKEIIEVYKITTVSTMKDARKMGFFRKRSMQVHIEEYRKHLEDAKTIDVSNIQIPSYDAKAKMLVDGLQRSVRSFCNLCEENMKFSQVAEQRQYKNSGVGIEEFKSSYNSMQIALEQALVELGDLDKAYRQYTADDKPEE